ncbi:MAG: tRNA 2-thiouridine(34) synthase MnmA [Bacteroidetes bacterium]|nr:tRNA 2-thiouridine(34) synthase MnmA [Bacteroidota bacterium]MDA1336589.1 tRNA 2-thiouridine(34) synthase MnmA [Bacteroidota bacterium]
MRIVVGLSGGVDSSVAAWLLKQAGHEVIGIFMRNWHDESVIIDNECPWIDDANDAMLVASHLGIPFQVLDLSEQYKERIVDYMFEEYACGRTPNPDVLCNREIKFDLFLQSALDLGAECVATGHYCRKGTTEVDGKTVHQLLAGVDNNKDQSYFLCQLTQAQLSQAVFPIGELTKPEVREIAEKIDLPTAKKKDSQGLCFIGKVRLPEFLQQQLEPKEGHIIEISAELAESKREQSEQPMEPLKWQRDDGQVVGAHQGAHFFTVGQRRGIQVGGKPEPLFVIEKNVEENILYVGQGENHPGLMRSALRIQLDEAHWIRTDLALKDGESTDDYHFRIRYRQPLQGGKLERKGNALFIWFDDPQSGIAAGQFAAWYRGDECIGSGVIAS